MPVWEGVAASVVYDALRPFFGSLLLLVPFLVIVGFRFRRARQLSHAVEDLLIDKNHAINNLLNAPVANPTQVQHDFNIWQSNMRTKLERLRRERMCTGWHIDHFETLGTVRGVTSPLGNSQLAGEIAEKAQRLKDIAKDLDDRAARLWPL